MLVNINKQKNSEKLLLFQYFINIYGFRKNKPFNQLLAFEHLSPKFKLLPTSKIIIF